MAAGPKILIAMDSFKGTLSANEACRAVENGIRAVQPNAECECIPLADGGSGTTDVFLRLRHGRRIDVPVMSPIGKEVIAHLAHFTDPDEVVLELAAASGLALIPESRRNPMEATSFGCGQLIARAFEMSDCVTVGLGDSGIVDGGVGAMQALGVRFLDERGETLEAPLVPKDFGRITGLDAGGVPRDKTVRVLSDVENPLHGRLGAARVFGPQKGASPEMVEQLAEALEHVYGLIEATVGRRVSERSGAGAAGGMGGALLAFFDAEIVSGSDFLIDQSSLLDHLANSDLVITGEGRFDRQSMMGKGPGRIVREAKALGIGVQVLAGSVEWDDRMREFLTADQVTGLIESDASIPSPGETTNLLAAAVRRALVRTDPPTSRTDLRTHEQ